jgi:molybdate transport system ATP-binding protein
MTSERIVAELRATRGAFQLDVALDIPSQGVTALFGASGSGKTTVLRCLAGLERADRGHVVVGRSAWQDDARRIWLSPHERRVGYVFQDAALFPHLSVAQNLEYGARRARHAARQGVRSAALDFLGIEPLLRRGVANLSGGERQRVAIARALSASPELILMDEPLASLDAAAKAGILQHLERLHRELAVPMIYVSHSIEEVARLADWLVWLDAGRVRSSGPAHQVLGGLELGVALGDEAASMIDAVVRRHDADYELTLLDSPWGELWTHRLYSEPGARVRVRIRARDVSLSLDETERSSVLNALPAVVVDAARSAPGEMLVRLGTPQRGLETLFACVTRKSFDELLLREGVRVRARIKGISVR